MKIEAEEFVRDAKKLVEMLDIMDVINKEENYVVKDA